MRSFPWSWSLVCQIKLQIKKKEEKNRIKLLKKNKQINKYKSILICLDWADPQLATRRHVAIYGLAGLGL